MDGVPPYSRYSSSTRLGKCGGPSCPHKIPTTLGSAHTGADPTIPHSRVNQNPQPRLAFPRNTHRPNNTYSGARAAAAARHLVAKGSRAHERRQKNCPQALVRYETLPPGNTTRWLWRHDWMMTFPTPLVTALLRMRLNVFSVTHKLKDWRKMDSGREENLGTLPSGL